MQRLWGSVFLMCPTMSYDAVKSKWQIAWGKIKDVRPMQFDASDKLRYLFDPLELEESDRLEEDNRDSWPEHCSQGELGAADTGS